MKNKTFTFKHLLLAVAGGIFVGGSVSQVSSFVNVVTTPLEHQKLTTDKPKSPNTLGYTEQDTYSLVASAFSSYSVAFDSRVPDVPIAISGNSTFETYVVENVHTKPLKDICHDGFYIEYNIDTDTELTCHTNYLSSAGTVLITLPKEESASDKLEHRVLVAGYGFSKSEGNMDSTSVPNAFDDDPVVLVGVELPNDKNVTFHDTITESDLSTLINLDAANLSEKLKLELNTDSLENMYRNRASTWL